MSGAANPNQAMVQKAMPQQGGPSPSYVNATTTADMQGGKYAGAVNPLLQQVPQTLKSSVADNPYQQAADAQKAAIQGTQAAMNYRPMMVRPTGYQAQGYGATGYNATMQGGPNSAASQMSNYTNPYENQVVQATLRDIESGRQTAMNNVGAQATSANAFGGSRHALVEAETNKAYTQQALDAAAKMRQQGFNTAIGAAQFDVGQQQSVNAANQMAANAAAQFGAGAANTAAQFGASAANAAGQYNASNQMTAQQLNQMAGMNANTQNLNAANQLSNLGNQSFNYGNQLNEQQMQQGAMQQAMVQQLMNAAKQQFAGYAGQPNASMNTFLSGISGMPNMGGTNTQNNAGLFNYLQVLGSMG